MEGTIKISLPLQYIAEIQGLNDDTEATDLAKSTAFNAVLEAVKGLSHTIHLQLKPIKEKTAPELEPEPELPVEHANDDEPDDVDANPRPARGSNASGSESSEQQDEDDAEDREGQRRRSTKSTKKRSVMELNSDGEEDPITSTPKRPKQSVPSRNPQQIGTSKKTGVSLNGTTRTQNPALSPGKSPANSKKKTVRASPIRTRHRERNGDPFQIFFRSGDNGKNHSLQVNRNTTIQELKVLIHRSRKILPAMQRLVFGGKPLNDQNRTLESHNIQGGDTVELGMRPRGG